MSIFQMKKKVRTLIKVTKIDKNYKIKDKEIILSDDKQPRKIEVMVVSKS